MLNLNALSNGLQVLAAVNKQSAIQAEQSSSDTSSTPAAISPGLRKISPGVSDAISRIKELIGGLSSSSATNNAALAAKVAEASAQTIVSSTGIPDDQIARFKGLGADAWVVDAKPAQKSIAAITLYLTQTMQEASTEPFYKPVSDDFFAALKNGTLTVKYASDVPEMGLSTVNVTLYKNGSSFGSAGYGTGNQAYMNQLYKSGIYASGGTLDGTDFVVMFAAPETTAAHPLNS